MNAQNHQTRQSAFAERLRGGMSLPVLFARRDYLSTAVLLALGFLAALLAIRVFNHVTYPFPLDGREGAILGSAWRAAQGDNIYAKIDRLPYIFTVSNPVVPCLSGLVIWLFGAGAEAPRIMAVLFEIGSALVIYLFIRRETASKAAGLVAALFFLVERPVYARSGYLIADWPALLFSLAGLYLWRSGGERRYAALVAFAFAFFSNQTALAAAAAAFISLYLEGRRGESTRLGVLFVMTVAAGLAISALFFGRAYFTDVFTYSPLGPWSMSYATRRAGTILLLYIIPAAGLVWLASRSIRVRALVLPVAYALLGLFVGLARCADGADRACFFDLAAGLAISAGYLWAGVEARGLAGKATPALMAAICLQIVLVTTGGTYMMSPFGDKTESDLREDSAIRRSFESVDGVILCEKAGLDIGTGAPNVSNDPPGLARMIRAGVVSPEVLLAPVRERAFALVIMPKNKGQQQFFSADLRNEVLQNYSYFVTRETRRNVYLVPRHETSGDADIRTY